jgi:hypothetical protein
MVVVVVLGGVVEMEVLAAVLVMVVIGLCLVELEGVMVVTV